MQARMRVEDRMASNVLQGPNRVQGRTPLPNLLIAFGYMLRSKPAKS